MNLPPWHGEVNSRAPFCMANLILNTEKWDGFGLALFVEVSAPCEVSLPKSTLSDAPYDNLGLKGWGRNEEE